MQLDSTTTAHSYELVVAEDLCSDLTEERHAYSLRHILPRLARITTSRAITFGPE